MDSTRLKQTLVLALAIAAGACTADPRPVILAGTTSTYDSGLLEHLVAVFREAHPDFSVRTVVAGSGEVLELGRRGDVDVMLVHAPDAERRFVAEGFAPTRHPLMSNEFVIVGPPHDPAGIASVSSPAEAMARIADSESGFVSRGDSSGTHYREIALWAAASTVPSGDWYIESGQGQATSLQVASERAMYTLTDMATLVVLQDVVELRAWVQEHPNLLNVYSLLQPRDGVQPDQVQVLMDWLLSPAAAALIAEFRYRGTDVPLFLPLGSETSFLAPGAAEVEARSVVPPDSVRGSAARGSPAHHFG